MGAGSAHVLVVEDNHHVTAAMRLLLESAGHRVSLADGVASAVAVCRTDPPSLMLLDLTLPDGDGLEVLAMLRKDGGPLPLTVALTGDDTPDKRARCLSAGCVDVLLKPVPARALIARVAALLNQAPPTAGFAAPPA